MTPSGICVKWSCPLCLASGVIDPVNPPETVIDAIDATHRMVSPKCPYSREDEEKEIDKL